MVDGEVGGQSGLHSLLADDSDSDICLKDHADVVAAVAHRGNPLAAGEFLEQPDNICLLSWAASADTEARS
jgi:hypothetical protein